MITNENHNILIDKIKQLLMNGMCRTENDYNNYDYLCENDVREIMDALYIPPRLNTLCKYEYSCDSYDQSYHNCKDCKDNYANRRRNNQE
jgi:hypothetical protein